LTRKGYICFSIGEDKISKIEIIDEATSETNFIFVHLTDQLNLGVLDEYTI
jgi:hypothetical protein